MLSTHDTSICHSPLRQLAKEEQSADYFLDNDTDSPWTLSQHLSMLLVMDDEDIRLIFGREVRRIRRSRGWSQEELAARVGLDRTYVGGVERGERNPGLMNIVRIAHALNVPIADLFISIDEQKRA